MDMLRRLVEQGKGRTWFILSWTAALVVTAARPKPHSNGTRYCRRRLHFPGSAAFMAGPDALRFEHCMDK